MIDDFKVQSSLLCVEPNLSIYLEINANSKTQEDLQKAAELKTKMLNFAEDYLMSLSR
jgi:hypothetical protein